MNNTTSVTWRRLRNIVKRRDKATCFHCGEIDENGHCDHLVPLVKGGTDSILNLVWSCESCNLKKGGNLPEETDAPSWSGYESKDEVPDDKSKTHSLFIRSIFNSLASVLVPPYPEYSNLDFPNYSIYFDRIAYLRSRTIEDWLRRLLWPVPPDAQHAIEGIDRCQRLISRVEKYHIVSKDVFLEKVTCPECNCPLRLQPDGERVSKFLCPAGHYGTYTHFFLNEWARDLRKVAIHWAECESGYNTPLYGIENYPAPVFFMLDETVD